MHPTQPFLLLLLSNFSNAMPHLDGITLSRRQGFTRAVSVIVGKQFVSEGSPGTAQVEPDNNSANGPGQWRFFETPFGKKVDNDRICETFLPKPDESVEGYIPNVFLSFKGAVKVNEPPYLDGTAEFTLKTRNQQKCKYESKGQTDAGRLICGNDPIECEDDVDKKDTGATHNCVSADYGETEEVEKKHFAAFHRVVTCPW